MGDRTQDAKGRLEEAVGDLTDDDDLKRKGKLDRAAAKVKRVTEDAVDKAKDEADTISKRHR